MKRKKENFRKYYEIIGKPIGKGGLSTVYKAKKKKEIKLELPK